MLAEKTGVYRGTVTANDDPEGLFRLRMQIPQVLGLVETDWAWPILPIAVGVTVPNVGEPVWVTFEAGDIERPVWMGVWRSFKPGGADPDINFGGVVSETTYGLASSNGTAQTLARSDHTHGSPSLTSSSPTTSAVGDSSAIGFGTTPARHDHRHAREAFGNVVAQTTYSAASGNGSASTVARSDHVHGTPALPSGVGLALTTLSLTDISSLTVGSQTNKVYTIQSGSTSTIFKYAPHSRFIWHDLLAFNRWWGAPTFETFTGSWAADTLNNGLWSQLENQAITVIDGATKTAARWTWNSSNIAFCYVEWWLLAFTYAGAVNSSKNILVESSADGSVWVTRHTSTGNVANAQPVLIYAPLTTADTWVRLTITVTNAITLPMSGIRALSSRWGNQGGGAENSLPYTWDSSQRMGVGAGAVPANAPLTVGTNTATSAGGMYFGTDTPLYRSGSNALSMTGRLTTRNLNYATRSYARANFR